MLLPKTRIVSGVLIKLTLVAVDPKTRIVPKASASIEMFTGEVLFPPLILGLCPLYLCRPKLAKNILVVKLSCHC